MLFLKGYLIKDKVFENNNEIIYKGEEIYKNKHVIIKFLKVKTFSDQEKNQIKRKYEISKKLDFPGVIKVYKMINDGIRIAVVMEDFDGINLQEFIDLYDLNLKEKLRVFIKIANIIDQIHKLNIVYKDINPNNIFINVKTKEIKFMNFGIASEMKSGISFLMKTNEIEGSLKYISPEQTGRTNFQVGYSSDLYSLGVILYQMCTKIDPFEYSNSMKIIHAHIARKPVSPKDLNKDIPLVISDIIMKLLLKVPVERYQNASGLIADLKECLYQLQTTKKINYFAIGKKDINRILQIPEKIYGRDKELDRLSSIFEKVQNNKKQLLVITGQAGIGKTYLVHKFCSEISENGCYYTWGKFDQYQNIPYSALVQAFKGLIKQLLMEPNEKLKIWKEKLDNALCVNGQVIIDVIPELELIIGKQPEVYKLDPEQTLNRFNQTFKKFLGVFTHLENPLIIFIDDIQWADSASMDLLLAMLEDKNNNKLFLILASRFQEQYYKLKNKWDEYYNTQIVNFNKISLKVFNNKEIIEIILNILDCSEPTARKIADLVIKKTDGSSFFVLQFLQELYNKSLIKYDSNCLQWKCNFEDLKNTELSDNLMELMVHRFNHLSNNTIEMLKVASCIGNTFSITSLVQVIHSIEEMNFANLNEVIDKGLSEAKEQEFIVPLNNKNKMDNNYKFVHDKIQQAAYNLLDNKTKINIHEKIGEYYTEIYSEEELREKVFIVVEQLNKTADLIISESNRIERIRLNLWAAEKAKISVAYESAIIYLKAGMFLTEERDWNDNHSLIFDLFKERIEIEFLLGNFIFSQYLIEKTLKHTKIYIERAKIYCLLLVQYTMQGKYQRAIEVGNTALKILGVDYAQKDLDNLINVDIKKLEEIFKNKRELFFENLIPMKNEDKIIAMDILSKLITTTYLFDNKLWKLTVITAVKLSLEYGYTSGTAYAYAGFGNVLVSHGEYSLANEFGQLALELNAKLNNGSQKCRVCEVVSGHLNHWKNHIKNAFKISDIGYQAGIECGELQFAAYIKMLTEVLNRFASGENLISIQSNLDEYLEFCEVTQNKLMVDFLLSAKNTIENLNGMKKNFYKNVRFEEEGFIKRCYKNNSLLSICYYRIFKQQEKFLFGAYKEGVTYSEKAEEYLKYIANTIMNSEHNWYYSLCLLACCKEASKLDKKKYMEKVLHNQEKMMIWSEHCQDNFWHKYLLVEAEIECIDGNYEKAERLYEEAINYAKKNRFVQDEGICNELTAEFYFRMGKDKIASLFLKEARSLYEIWGARRKVCHMENKYPEIFNRLNNNKNYYEQRNIYQVDIETIMNISQSISGEIELDNLIKRLLKILLENAGAEKGIFLMKSDDKMRIQGYIDLNKTSIMQNILVNQYSEIPQSIIDYVIRTKENIVINNAYKEGLFTHDDYIVKNKIKSIFCIPIIYLNNLKGIVYLENNITVGAFTDEYIEMISMFSSQIAISIENALMFEKLISVNTELEKKVENRTEKIKKTIKKLQCEIKERKKAELTLQESEERYRFLVELMPDMLYIRDGNKLLFANKAGAKILGYDNPREMFGKQITELFKPHPDYSEKLKQNFKLIENKKELSLLEEKLIRRKDNKLIYLETSSRNFKHKGKDVTLLVARDIAERKRLEELRKKAEKSEKLLNEALEYDKLKTEFFANMSHEFKTPLNVLLGAIQMMQLMITEKSLECNYGKVEKYCKIMKQNCFRLIRLVNNIIDISKIDSGYFNYSPRYHNIVSVVEDITLSVAEYIENHGIKLIFDTEVEEQIVFGDPDKIERIVLNLLSNAVKFTESGGNIFVNIYSRENSIIISIKDTGIGIPKEKQKLIFKRFMQIDKSLSRNKEGSGIGLSLVEGIVQLHGGNITLNSESGKGSEFLIQLPVVDEGVIKEEKLVPKKNLDKDNENIERIHVEFSDIYF